jgi:hypothetical protein
MTFSVVGCWDLAFQDQQPLVTGLGAAHKGHAEIWNYCMTLLNQVYSGLSYLSVAR